MITFGVINAMAVLNEIEGQRQIREAYSKVNEIRRAHGYEPYTYIQMPRPKVEIKDDSSEYSLGLGILIGGILGNL